jgi:hypothetical protein
MVERTQMSNFPRSEVEWIIDNAEKWIHVALKKAAGITIGSYAVKRINGNEGRVHSRHVDG